MYNTISGISIFLYLIYYLSILKDDGAWFNLWRIEIGH